MKIVIASLTALVWAAPVLSQAAEAPVETAAPARRRAGGGAPNSNDVFYTLGPDSKSRDGVPKGKFTGPKVIQSNVFPGTQHTYWIYVPAQYDPAQPTALMVFNDGQAMMAEPGDVQAHHVLDNLIFRREIPVMLGVFINPERVQSNPRIWHLTPSRPECPFYSTPFRVDEYRNRSPRVAHSSQPLGLGIQSLSDWIFATEWIPPVAGFFKTLS